MKVKLSDHNHQKCILAQVPIAKNEMIVNVHGKLSSLPDKYSIQVGDGKHITPLDLEDEDSLWAFTNHSCEPNAFFDLEEMSFKALKNIKEGEEITYDYETTEETISNPFQCACNSTKCKGEIKGSKAV